MELTVSNNESKKTYTLSIELSEEEFLELDSLGDLIQKDLVESVDKGLGRKKYCVTCHGKGPNNSEVRWTEKAYNSTLADIQGAPKCQRDTGNPSNSVRKGNC